MLVDVRWGMQPTVLFHVVQSPLTWSVTPDVSGASEAFRFRKRKFARGRIFLCSSVKCNWLWKGLQICHDFLHKDYRLSDLMFMRVAGIGIGFIKKFAYASCRWYVFAMCEWDRFFFLQVFAAFPSTKILLACCINKGYLHRGHPLCWVSNLTIL